MRQEKISNIREQSKFELPEVRKNPWAQAEYRLGFGSVGMERKLPFGIRLAAFNVSIGMVEIPRLQAKLKSVMPALRRRSG